MLTNNNEVFASQERETLHQGNKEALFDRLIPIIFVGDPNAEQDFYMALGFTVTYQESVIPNFIEVTYGSIKFGIERAKDFSPQSPGLVLTWRFSVENIDAVKEKLVEVGVRFREEWVTSREDWKYRVLHTRTPNGYHLFLEGPRES